MVKILIGSPIRQKPNILKEFLISLHEIQKTNLIVDYIFADDNNHHESSKMLLDFAKTHNTKIIKYTDITFKKSIYNCDTNTHVWDENAISKITVLKNLMLEHSVKHNYDYIFLIDSDIIVQKETLLHLLARNKMIISNIFWTQWIPNCEIESQLFYIPNIKFYLSKDFSDTTCSEQEVTKCIVDTNTKLMIPGIYEVNGLGACTLINTKILKNINISFSPIKALSVFGEDRFFCVRASACGYKLYLDTCLPAFHIYREEYLDRIEDYKTNGFNFEMCKSLINYPKKSKFKIIFNSIKNFIKDFVKIFWKRYKLIKEINLNKRKKRSKSNDVATIIYFNKNNEASINKITSNLNDITNSFIIVGDIPNLDKENLKLKFNNKQLIFIPTKTNQKNLKHYIWSKIRKINPGWIISFNSNEYLEKDSLNNLKILLKNSTYDGFNFKIQCKNLHKKHFTQNTYLNDVFYPFVRRYYPKLKYIWPKENGRICFLPIYESNLLIADVDLIKVEYIDL